MLTVNNRRQRIIWDDIEAGLGSGAQFRVLLHLVLKPEEAYTKYSLVKATGLRTPAVTQQLERLLELGWIRKHESSVATYQINPENEVVRLIYELFRELKHTKQSNKD
jgi:DNA-binding MarR family transcriptional regulator